MIKQKFECDKLYERVSVCVFYSVFSEERYHETRSESIFVKDSENNYEKGALKEFRMNFKGPPCLQLEQIHGDSRNGSMLTPLSVLRRSLNKLASPCRKAPPCSQNGPIVGIKCFDSKSQI